MPLDSGTSDKARSKNIAIEAKKKPLRQAIAIAYSVQRANREKAGK
jgi:hypothetical protein